MEISIRRTTTPKPLPAPGERLGFGRLYTDHMFVMDYSEGRWHDPRILPYGPIALDPAAMILHYGQEVFEGMKAYRAPDGGILLFRPEENFRRLRESCERLCIPPVEEELAMQALTQLVAVDERWIPHGEGESLYIRPFLIATEAQLGVHVSDRYQFLIIMTPVGSYYANGLAPVKIRIESGYVRAVKGGTGMAKTGGNYASSLKAQQEAADQGYDQVLWLDGVERRYIEEVGTMNVFFVIDGEVITPSLEGSILSGITRKSVIQLLRSEGYPVRERRISVDELAQAADGGTLQEAFGTGTAAVISPIGEFAWQDRRLVMNGGGIGPVSRFAYETLTAIQWGRRPDPFGWVHRVETGKISPTK